MAGKITRAQYEDLVDAYEFESDQVFIEKLEEYTGIRQVPYTAYSYFDANNNYVGCSDDFDLRDILENAYIEVVDDA